MKIETKENTDTLDFINIKSICSSKNTIMKMKGKLTERARHFAYFWWGTYLYKNSYNQLNNKKTNNPLKNELRFWIESSPKKIC